VCVFEDVCVSADVCVCVWVGGYLRICVYLRRYVCVSADVCMGVGVEVCRCCNVEVVGRWNVAVWQCACPYLNCGHL
jgi:hypothetical protein